MEKWLDKQWRGRAAFEIQAGVKLPAEELSHVNLVKSDNAKF